MELIFICNKRERGPFNSFPSNNKETHFTFILEQAIPFTSPSLAPGLSEEDSSGGTSDRWDEGSIVVAPVKGGTEVDEELDEFMAEEEPACVAVAAIREAEATQQLRRLMLTGGGQGMSVSVEEYLGEPAAASRNYDGNDARHFIQIIMASFMITIRSSSIMGRVRRQLMGRRPGRRQDKTCMGATRLPRQQPISRLQGGPLYADR